MCYTNQGLLDLLNKSGHSLTGIVEFDEYKVTKHCLPYIYTKKRKSVLEKTFLLKVERNDFNGLEN